MRTLILKSLSDCNLRCAYCSLGSKEHPHRLSEPDTLRALRLFAERCAAEGEQNATVIFHGGEPMLLPPAQYERCIRTVTAERPEIRFRFCMQTNGTLMTPEYLQLFQNYDIHVGVSVDGDSFVHDGQRTDAAGHGTYQTILRNIRLLQENQVSTAALMVATKRALDGSLEFLREFDAMRLPLKINPLLSLGEAVSRPELSLEPGDYGRYLARAFEYVAENQLALHISPIEELLHAMLYEETPCGCQYDPCCSRRFLCVSPQGVLYPCGRFADGYRNPIGTLTSGITAEGETVLERLRRRRTTELPDKCRTCEILQYCNAGCSSDRMGTDRERQPCASCEDYLFFIRYLKSRGMELVRQSLLHEKERLQSYIRRREAAYGL